MPDKDSDFLLLVVLGVVNIDPPAAGAQVESQPEASPAAPPTADKSDYQTVNEQG